MKPLEVVATLRGGVALPNGPLALDGLVAAAVAIRDGMVRPTGEGDILPIEIPIQRAHGGRFHLASVGFFEVDASERRWVNRRFPIGEAQQMGDARLRTARINAGPCKSYRLPLATHHAKDDRMTWWCIGDAGGVEDLLALISYVGKKRSTGNGRVAAWSVREMAVEELWDGFPVLRDGLPLRALPLDWPGLCEDAPRGYSTITYPYWTRWLEEPLAMPVEAGA